MQNEGGSEAGEGLEGYSPDTSADDSTANAGDSEGSDSADENDGSPEGEEDGDGDAGDDSDGQGEDKGEQRQHRTLAQLAKAIESGDTDSITDEEAKRLRIAAARKLRTDDDVDAWIAKSKGQKPKPKASKADAADEGEEEADGETSEQSDDAEDTDTEEGAEDSALAEMFPDIKDPKERVAQVKGLKENLDKVQEVLEKVGFQSIEDVLQSEEDIGKHLGTVDGLKKMYKVWGIKPPINLDGTAAPAKPGKGKQAPAADDGGEDEGDLDLDSIDEETFIQGRDIKRLASTLSKQIRAELEEEYKPLKEEVSSITKKAAEEQERIQRESRRTQAYREADFVSKEWGEHFPEYRLKDSAEKVWADSVTTIRDRDGKLKVALKKTRHAEFPILEKILDFREEALKKGMSVNAFIGTKFMDKKILADIVKKQATKAKVDTLTNQRKRLQPPMANRGAAAPASPFKVPESDADIATMGTKDVDALHRRIARGELKIKG